MTRCTDAAPLRDPARALRLMTDLHAALTGDRAGHAHTGAAYASAGAGYAPTGAGRSRRTAVVLTRLLFLLYGDDAGLWEPGLFHRFVLHHTTPATLGPQLARLFRLLGTAEGDRRHVPAAMAGFPPVTDGLFAEECPPGALPADVREALLAACRFRWTRISPAVFGSALQLVTSAKDRRAGGEHYTTEENILRVVDPLFLDELRAEARRLLRDPSTTVAELRRFRDRLAETVVVDPACGCGNFLAVAYREMRAVETEVIVAILGREREREREQERKQEGEGGGPGAG
ncbi:DNA methyltransferase, partial [Corynebacterium bovis]